MGTPGTPARAGAATIARFRAFGGVPESLHQRVDPERMHAKHACDSSLETTLGRRHREYSPALYVTQRIAALTQVIRQRTELVGRPRRRWNFEEASIGQDAGKYRQRIRRDSWESRAATRGDGDRRQIGRTSRDVVAG
jgi:hypothetical protein